MKFLHDRSEYFCNVDNCEKNTKRRKRKVSILWDLTNGHEHTPVYPLASLGQ